MRKVKVLIIGAAAALVLGCAPPVLSTPSSSCSPTSIQPTSRPLILLGRVDGCPNLLAVSGGPGITLYITLDKLPLVRRGEG